MEMSSKIQTQREINKLKDFCVESAKGISCESILHRAGMKTKVRGKQLYFSCPKCGDGTVKSDKCSVNLDRNLFHCFGCGFSGGAPKLYSVLKGVSYVEAAVELCLINGYITKEQYEGITGCQANLTKLRSDSVVYEKFEEKDAEIVEQKAPVAVIDLVYRHMLRFPQFSLSESAFQYLVETRRLSKQEIEEQGFFTYHDTFSVDALVENIRKEKPDFSYNDFLGVPGFFFAYTNKEHTKGVWMCKGPCPNYLGIPLRNSHGQISALQLRYMKKSDRANKYIFFSSNNIKAEELDVAFGSTCGSPVAVCYPERLKNATFCVGEGFFKMKELCKREGSITFSVQGVNTFRYVGDEVRECFKDPKTRKLVTDAGLQSANLRFLIVYDSDMYTKIQVLEAGVKTASFLKKEFPNTEVLFLVWKPEYGKGYDDMVFSCNDRGIDYHSVIRAVPAAVFEKLTEEAVKESDVRYFSMPENTGVKRDIKCRQTAMYQEILKNAMLNRVFGSF